MRKTHLLPILFALLLIYSLVPMIFSLMIEAGQFGKALVRIDRQKINSSTSGMICAQPATGGTENSVQVSFPSGFNVSGLISNWTVSTSDLLAGSTPWPGINTALSVVGQTVTFPSADLSTGTLYCFRWNNPTALTTGTAGSTHTGTITTRTAGSLTIDTSTFVLSVQNNDQISVTATVPAQNTDGEITLSSQPDTTTLLRENDVVTFTVSYRTSLSYSTGMRVEAQWEKGTIEGTSNEVEVFDYVIGSATNSDDGTPPVVDLVNRTVTWNIASVSPSVNHTVTFKLKVRSNLPTENRLTTDVTGTGVLAGTQLPQSTLNFNIQKLIVSGAEPTATPAPGPTSIPTPGQPTPTPSRPSQTFGFDFVRIDEVSNNSAIVSFQTSNRSVFTLAYGTSLQTLTQAIEGLSYEKLHRIELAGLDASTRYYFRITARDESGRSIRSDIFTFQTASDKQQVNFSREDIAILWRKYALTSPDVNTIVLPKKKPVIVSVRIKEPGRVVGIRAVFKNVQVLGINNVEDQANIEESPLVEILPGVFSGEIQPPEQKGLYQIFFEIKEVGGNLYTKSSPYQFYTSEPLRVVSAKTKKPIENAQIKILKYEEGSKKYSPLGNSFALPLNTDETGALDVVLPTGRYVFETTAIGYKDRQDKAELGISNTQYPQIEMEADFSFLNTIRDYQDSAKTVYAYLAEGLQNFFSSFTAQDFMVVLTFSLIMIYAAILRVTSKQGSIEIFYKWLAYFIFISSLNFFVTFSILSAVAYTFYHGVVDTLPLIVGNAVLICLWFLHSKRLWTNQIKTPTKTSRS